MTSSHSVKLKMLLCKKGYECAHKSYCMCGYQTFVFARQVKSCNFYTFNMFMIIKGKWLDGNKNPRK